DQAYGLYVLTPVAILAARWRRRLEGEPIVRVFIDRTTVLTAAVAAGVFLLGNNVVFNFKGFVAHVQEVLGPASSSYQMFSGTVAGQLRMAGLALRELLTIFGWPLGTIAAIGVVSGLADRSANPPLRWLLVPVVSYYAAFLAVVLYFFDR